VTFDRAFTPSKLCRQRFSTEDGMLTETQLPTAPPLVQESVEPDSKVTVERDRQSKKQLWKSFTIVEGMQIDESEVQQENALFSI
jgi:hypothetical protein